MEFGLSGVTTRPRDSSIYTLRRSLDSSLALTIAENQLQSITDGETGDVMRALTYQTRLGEM